MSNDKEKGVAAPTTTPNTESRTNKPDYTPDFAALADIIRDEAERELFIKVFCSMDVPEHDPEDYLSQFEGFDDLGLDGYFLAALINDYSFRALRLAQFLIEYPRLPQGLVDCCRYYIATAMDYTEIYQDFEDDRMGVQ